MNESFSAEEDFIPAEIDEKSKPPCANSAHGAPFASRGILDCPHYTRPQSFRGWEVPEVLVGGNHEQIRGWRREKAIEKTRRNRPDLLLRS